MTETEKIIAALNFIEARIEAIDAFVLIAAQEFMRFPSEEKTRIVDKLNALKDLPWGNPLVRSYLDETAKFLENGATGSDLRAVLSKLTKPSGPSGDGGSS